MLAMLVAALLQTEAPPKRDILANNAFFYYADVDRAYRFYTETLGLETAADYGFAKILQVAGTSYLTVVDASKGMHTKDEPKTVALALVTDDLEEWYEHLKSRGVPMRNELRVEPGRPHDGFVAIDPEGYYLELDTFLAVEGNEELLRRLAAARTP